MMSHKIKLFYILYFLQCGIQLYGQQSVKNSQVFLHPLLVNPAFTGLADNPKAVLQYKKEWVGIENSPEGEIFSIDTDIHNKNVGLGFVFTNEVTNIITQTSGNVLYRYKLKMRNDYQYLSMGVSAGLFQNGIDFSKIRVEDMTENTILKNNESITRFDASVGLVYNFNHLRIGIAAKHLTNSYFQYTQQALGQKLNYRLIRQFGFYTDYALKTTKQLTLNSMVYVQSTQGLPLSGSLACMGVWNNAYWVGVEYDYYSGLYINVAVKGYGSYLFAYSYGIPTMGISYYSRGSHLVSVGVLLTKNKVTYTNTLSPEEMDNLVKISKIHGEEIATLNYTDATIKNKIDSAYIELKVQEESIQTLRKIYESNKDSIENVKQLLIQQQQFIGNTNQKEFRKEYASLDSQFIDTSIVLKNKNTSYYLVLGSFLKMNDARYLQRIIYKELGITSYVLDVPEYNCYFVYIKKYNYSDNITSRLSKDIKRYEAKGVGQYLDGSKMWIYQSKK